MSKKGKKYEYLLEDEDLRRWFDNIGSNVTSDVYLRRLGGYCEKEGLTPKELLNLEKNEIFNKLLDLKSEMERDNHAGSYTKSILKAIKSWLRHNDIDITKKINIKNVSKRPTLREERVPTQEELRKIFLAGDLRGKVACSLVAHSGLRMGVIGNYRGDDGLVIGDIPDIIIEDKIEFEQIPVRIVVRSELSKTKNSYFTFLSSEGCDYLKGYLEMRLRRGEELNKNSSVITPKYAKKDFIRSTNISDTLRKCIRKAGFSWRPYVLRSYFDTQLMLAESKGKILRDYREFFMGHVGDIEHVYTLNKRRLSPHILKDLRESYKRSQKFLQTIETEKHEDIKTMFKKQLLSVAGFKEDEIKDEYLEMEPEEFQELVRKRLAKEVFNNGVRQKLVEENEVESYLNRGWEFVNILPNTNKAVLKIPAS